MRQGLVAHRNAAPRTTGPAHAASPRTALGLSPAPRTLGGPHVPAGRSASAEPAVVAATPHRREPLSRTLAGQGPEQVSSLAAHLLGRFRVTLNEAPVDNLPSGRSRALLEYLLTHRDPWPPREALMEVFWPGATPAAARNSLNVAVHTLRRAFRAVDDVQVLKFEQGSYRLHPDLRLWVDVDGFDHHVQAGRQLEAVGDLAGAMAEYELAVSLYQGDFLADDPYEEWPVLTREHLRLTHLDTVDRLSYLYFSQGRYAPCAAMCQRILERDPCQEDAHRRLMRCYRRQGQLHLALRQYRICVEALRAELGIDPAAETIALHEQIRRRESV